MSFTHISDLSVTSGQSTVTVASDEPLTTILAGDVLHLLGHLPVLIDSVDSLAKTIALVEPWSGADALNVAAVAVPTSADFRSSTNAVKKLTSIASQSVNQWEALTQSITTVSITIPGEPDVVVDSIPKVINDATLAGTTLMDNAQAALDLIGDAPTFAQSVSDNKDLVVAYINTAPSVEVEPGQYSMLHYYNSTVALHSDVSGWQSQVSTQTNQFNLDKASFDDAYLDFTTVQLPAANAHVLAANKARDSAISAQDAAQAWAVSDVDVLPGLRGAKYYAEQAASSAASAAEIVGGDYATNTRLDDEITTLTSSIGNLTKADIGLSNVPNFTATSDMGTSDSLLATQKLVSDTQSNLQAQLDDIELLALAGI